MPAAAFILALLIHPLGSLGGTVQAQTSPKAPASDSTESQADIAARSLDGNTTLTWAELDELILARRAMSKDGRESLRHLAQTKLLDVLGKQNGLSLSDAEVQTQLEEIKRQIVASGEKGGFEGFLKDKHVTLVEFMRLLRLGSVQETLTRRTLGLKDGERVTGEQQQMWMDDALQKRNYQEFNPPWADGIVAQCADVVIKQDEFFDYLHLRLPEEALKEDCWQLLAVKRMKARMPDLAPEKLAKAVEEELQRRREETKRDPRYKGVSYESLLTTQGVMADRMNRDPAVQIAALTKLWVERSYDDASLQRVYKDERDLFDGGYGAAVDTSMIFLRAAAFKNEFNPRTFIEADQMLRDMRGRIRSIDDFHKVAKESSEDAQTKDQSGSVGYVTARVAKVPAEVQAEIAKAIATDASASAEASMVGPIHAPNGSVLLWFGLRRPAPSWDVMSQHVKAELRRRFVEDVLPHTAVVLELTGGDTRLYRARAKTGGCFPSDPRVERGSDGKHPPVFALARYRRVSPPSLQSRDGDELMLIGKVVGSVVATRKDEKMENRKLLLVQVHDHNNKPKDQYVVAVDSVGAGNDEMVLYATGSSARQTTLTENRPCDAVIMAVVDSWDLGGDNVYEKWS